MKRSVFRWLRKKAEPYFGEALVRGADFLKKAGLPESVVEKITDRTLSVAPKLLQKLEEAHFKTDRYPVIIDRNPRSVNPTFDVPADVNPAAPLNPTFDIPPPKRLVVRKDPGPTKFDMRRYQMVDNIVPVEEKKEKKVKKATRARKKKEVKGKRRVNKSQQVV